jgi:eukaryotic-like serine/threonine-protein kinase
MNYFLLTLATLLLLLLLLSFGTGAYLLATAQTNKDSFETYSNPTFGIRIQYPPDWGRLDLSFLGNDSLDIDFYPLEDVSQAIAVKVQAKTLPSQNVTIGDYTRMQINYTEEQLLESNSTTLAGLPAHEIVFTDLGLKTMQIWTIKDDKVYTITYVAEEEDFQGDLQIAERMIKSLEITG